MILTGTSAIIVHETQGSRKGTGCGKVAREMVKRMIASGFLCCMLLTGICDDALADRAANGSLKWHSIRDYARLRDSVDRKIYIHFWAEWCGYCRAMEKETFANPAVVALLQKKFFLIKVNTDRDQRVADAFKVQGVPFNLFLSESGTEIDRRQGYIPPKRFKRVLEAIVNAH